MYSYRSRSKVSTTHRTLGWPRAFTWRGSIVPKALLPTFILSLWATGVSLLQTSIYRFFWPSSIIFITITSFVLSLLLGFRSNTAYERYWEGRRMWSNLSVATRNFSRLVWISADTHPQHDDLKERSTVLALLLAFLICIRNHARNHHSLIDADGALLKEFFNLFPSKLKLSPTRPFILTQPKYAHADILYLLNCFVDDLFRRKCLDVPQCNQLITFLNSMNDSLTSIERILTTPMPLAYNLHLKQIMYIYLFMLPFQLVGDHGFVAILITAVATFVFVGVDLIASEIENPFGLDVNDLDIEDFIADLEVELSELTASKPSNIKDWSFETPTNQESAVVHPRKPQKTDPVNHDINSLPAVQQNGTFLSTLLNLQTLLGIATISNRVIHSGNSEQAGLFGVSGADALAADAGDVAAVGGSAGGAGAGADE